MVKATLPFNFDKEFSLIFAQAVGLDNFCKSQHELLPIWRFYPTIFSEILLSGLDCGLHQ
jgi:hypothetical protein